MIDSLYAKYIEERQGLRSVWKDYGFVTYRIAEKECFIVDMFIECAHRRENKGRALLNELIETAIEQGCDVMTANIMLADPNANGTLRAVLACGFEVKDCGNRVLLIAKEI